MIQKDEQILIGKVVSSDDVNVCYNEKISEKLMSELREGKISSQAISINKITKTYLGRSIVSPARRDKLRGCKSVLQSGIKTKDSLTKDLREMFDDMRKINRDLAQYFSQASKQ